MKEAVARIVEKEGSNGLVITKAIYGKIRDEDKTMYFKRKLHFFVKNNFI